MVLCDRPTRLLVYDLHTLQNRFYLHGSTIASLQTTIPVLLEALRYVDLYVYDCVYICYIYTGVQI